MIRTMNTISTETTSRGDVVNNPDHTEPPIRSKVSHQSAQTEPPEKGGQNGGFRAK